MKKIYIIFLTYFLFFLFASQYVFAVFGSEPDAVIDVGLIDGLILFIMLSIVAPIMFPFFFWKDSIFLITVFIIGYLIWKYRKEIKKIIKLKFKKVTTL